MTDTMTHADRLRAGADYLEAHGLAPISVYTTANDVDLHLRWPDYLNRLREEGHVLADTYRCSTDTYTHYRCTTTARGVVLSGLRSIAPDLESDQ